MTRARRRLLALAAALVLVLSACAPVAQFARDVLDTSDGATLSYMLRTESTLPGLVFDAGPAPALGAILIARGSELEVLGIPDGVLCNATPELVDCRLGDVLERAYVYLTGRSVAASVTYRREGEPRVYQTFAR
ncbi:hypothetical protein [Natronococcus sp.]|uniref:hypothetical protein n=1 Tax=Natronococcus sp. TaxID=35747 RepID=UPI003A4E5244